jgi:hypothetical protein
VKAIFELGRVVPQWARILDAGPVLDFYALARGYILMEVFVSLRALACWRLQECKLVRPHTTYLVESTAR